MPLRSAARSAVLVFCLAALQGWTVSGLAQSTAAGERPIAIPADAAWIVRPPAIEPVSFSGLVSFDQAGSGSGVMLYPAPNMIGLLAAILTHGAINEAARSSERKKLQEEADKVLAAYRTALGEITHRALLEQALATSSHGGTKRIEGDAAAAPGSWRVDVVPLFTMTQDQSALLLDNAVAVFPPGRTEPVYRNTVRVVLRPRDSDNLEAHWLAEGAAALKSASAALLAESLDVALADMVRTGAVDEGSYRTIRYLEGKATRIERAAVLSERCGRLVIRTLRGWVKSVPAKSPTETPPADCQAPDGRSAILG
jgi:hypothetical protein